jgi:ubiquinone biosynthesis protein
LGTLVIAVVKKNANEIIRVAKSMDLLGELVDESLLKLDLLEFIDRYHGLSLGMLNAEEVIHDLLQILRRHHILLPVNLALIGRMLAISSGVGRMLDPEFDLIEEAKPFVSKFIARRYDPRRRLKSAMETWENYQMVLKNLPSDMEDIMSKVKQGKMLVSLHHEGLNRFILEMDRSTNRLTFGLIIASLIISSSFIMQVDIGLTLYGFPLLGLAGYLIAGILGLWLVIAILRSGRI